RRRQKKVAGKQPERDAEPELGARPRRDAGDELLQERIARAVGLAGPGGRRLADDTGREIQEPVAGVAEQSVEADADASADVERALHSSRRPFREAAPGAVARDAADDADERAELGAESRERSEPGPSEGDRRLQEDRVEDRLQRSRRQPVRRARRLGVVEA